MSVGADIDNGHYAMLGARMGCFSTVLDVNNINDIRDLNKMGDYFADKIMPENIVNDLELYGNSIRQRLDIPLADYSIEDSVFYKFVMPQHKNTGVQDREYE